MSSPLRCLRSVQTPGSVFCLCAQHLGRMWHGFACLGSRSKNGGRCKKLSEKNLSCCPWCRPKHVKTPAALTDIMDEMGKIGWYQVRCPSGSRCSLAIMTPLPVRSQNEALCSCAARGEQRLATHQPPSSRKSRRSRNALHSSAADGLPPSPQCQARASAAVR